MLDRDDIFSFVLNESQSLIRAYIAGIGVPFDQADDIAQDVFIHYYKEFDKKPTEVDHIPWLKGIAKNYSLRYFEKIKKEKLDKEKLLKVMQLVQESESAIEPGVSEKVINQMKECLQSLSENNLNILKSRYEEGLSYEQLGKAYNGTTQSMGMILMRIKKSLQKCISKGLVYDTE
jgi:RNA polymerase sigma factor (sigma-70 family)